MLGRIEKKKKERFLFLEKLYELTNGSELVSFNRYEIGEGLGFDETRTDDVTAYLIGESLTKSLSLDGDIRITHQGVVEMEKALSNPSEATTYFPPVSIINIHSMSHSQIQQGTHDSSITIHQSFDFHSLRHLLSDLKEYLPKIPPTERGFIEGEIQSIEGQLKAKEPKVPIIKQCLGEIQHILKDVAIGVAAGLLIERIGTLML